MESLIDRVMSRAVSWVGREFRPGEPAQCANFVRQVFADAGVPLGVADPPDDIALIPGYPTGPSYADSFAGDAVGRLVSIADRQPGDIVMYANTYGHYPDGTITHVGIYAGHDMVIHRPTADRAVCRVPFDFARIAEIRRPYFGLSLSVLIVHGRLISAYVDGRPDRCGDFKIYIKPERASVVYDGVTYTDPDVLRLAVWWTLDGRYPAGVWVCDRLAIKIGNAAPEQARYLQVLAAADAAEGYTLMVDGVPYSDADIALQLNTTN